MTLNALCCQPLTMTRCGKIREEAAPRVVESKRSRDNLWCRRDTSPFHWHRYSSRNSHPSLETADHKRDVGVRINHVVVLGRTSHEIEKARRVASERGGEDGFAPVAFGKTGPVQPAPSICSCISFHSVELLAQSRTFSLIGISTRGHMFIHLGMTWT